MPVERLREGDRILVEEGELIPADGRLLGGPAVIDERLVRGVSGLSLKQPGDRILAGSLSVEGTLEIEIRTPAHAAHAALLGRELFGASLHHPTGLAVTPHGENFGRRAVAPTLATAGLGLLVGDLTTAAAILRPDYATGPGLGVSLESVRNIADCACSAFWSATPGAGAHGGSRCFPLRSRSGARARRRESRERVER